MDYIMSFCVISITDSLYVSLTDKSIQKKKIKSERYNVGRRIYSMEEEK